MENSIGDKSDELEIISIGTLYQGSWVKKYWSSSRGKDRFPYPIGYHAVRTHIGITYRMEIREGLKGPLFVITSNDGESSTGPTPDIAWKQFQKNGSPKVKLGLGKRFSCKIDGVELFGFRNPLVQRLLRELVTSASGTAERSLLSSNVNNGDCRLDSEAEPPNSCMYPELLPHLVKPANTRKRSRKQNNTPINSGDGITLKRFQNKKNSDDVEVAITRRGNWGHDRASPVLAGLTILVHDPSLVKDCSFSQSPKLAESLGGDATFQRQHKDVSPEDSIFTSMDTDLSKQEKHIDRSSDVEIQGCNSIMETEYNKEEMMNITEFKTAKDLDLCAPDTLDGVQDDVAESVPESYMGNSFHAKDELAVAYAVDSEELVMNIHPKEELGTSISNASSKSDSDSVEPDLANSMMTLLLPQALPLLKKNLSKKQPTTHSSEICHTNEDPCLKPSGVKTAEVNDGLCNIAEVATPGKLEVRTLAEALHVDREEKMHTFGKVRGSDFPSSEDVNYVIPDSLEECQSENHVIDQRPPCSDFIEDDQALFCQMEYKPDTSRMLECSHGPQESPDFNVKTGGGIEPFNCEVPETQNEIAENKILISGSPVGCIAPCRQILLEGESMDVPFSLDGNSLCVETHFGVDKCTTKDLVILPDCIKDTSSSESTFLMHNHSYTPHSESIPKCNITNLNPGNEPAVSPNRLQNRETAFSPSCSTSTEKLETVYNEISKSKLAQYQRRHRSTNPKLQNTNVYWDQSDDLNAHRNQDSINTQRLCEISYTKDVDLTRTESSDFVSCKEVAPGTFGASSIHMPGLGLSTRKYNGPLTESIICRSAKEDCVPETYTASTSMLATEIDQASGDIINKNMSFGSEIKPEGQCQGLNRENQKGIFRTNRMVSKESSNEFHSETVAIHDAKYKDVLSFADPSIPEMEKHEVDSVNEFVGPHNLLDCNNSLPWFQEGEKSSFDNNEHDFENILANIDLGPHLKSVSRQNCRNLLSHSELNQDCSLTVNAEPNKGSESCVECLGCYLHPTPVLSILLSMQGGDIHICVLCGLLQDRNMTLFIYKLPIKQPREGCPSFLGYTSIVLPISNSTLCRKNAFERSRWQFTPDGQSLILPNNIMAPACREGSILCSCSLCTSDSFEENAVKVVNVRLGYVSLVAKLKTVESVQCILVCEPSHLVAAEASGRLHVWVMNSKWSSWVEEFVLPGLDYISPCIVELKRVPKCNFLIVGHDSYGDFGLWDISKRILLSRFSAPGNSVFQVIPVGFFSWQTKGSFDSADTKEHSKAIMAATEMFFSGSTENHAFVSSNEEDLAVWLLISSAHNSEDQYNFQENGINTSPVGCWRLALLVKNTVILGSVLDPRASTIDASAGHGVIGTSDGLVYMWELSTGRKLVDLHYFKSGRVSCITSDPKSGVIAVANEEGQLLVYATLSKSIEN